MKPRRIIIISLLIYFLGMAIFFLFNFYYEKNCFAKLRNHMLYNGAMGMIHLLGSDFHNSLTNHLSVMQSPYITNPDLLRNYILYTDLEAIFMLKEINGKYYYTALAMRDNAEFEKLPLHYLYQPFTNNIQAIKKARMKGKPVSALLSLGNKKLHALFIPLTSTSGIDYIAVAALRYSQFSFLNTGNIFLSFVSGFYFLLIFIPIFIIYLRELNREQQKMLKSLYTDQLTLLPNRSKLFMDIKNTRNPILMLINIDSFQQINTFYGSKVGDFILIAVANRIKYLLQDNKFELYRLYADEFAILIDKSISQDELKMFLEFLSSGINEKIFKYQSFDISVTVSIGVSIAEESELPWNELWQLLVSEASVALHTAKKKHMNFLIYDHSFDLFTEPEINLRWSTLLKEAVHEERIVPFYQPIMNNHTKTIEKYECLVRLIDRNGNVFSPNSFLEVAKRYKIYPSISHIMLEKSFSIFENTPFEFSINITVSDILNQDTRDYIIHLLYHHPEIGKRLVLEIVESEGIESFDKVKNFLLEMKKYGVKIALDDFGTGYSSYENILKLGVNYLKIDGTLIRDLPNDYNSKIIVKSIHSFAREMGLQTIAEYVSNSAVQTSVLEIGIDYSQGYFIGKPERISVFN